MPTQAESVIGMEKNTSELQKIRIDKNKTDEL